MAAGTAAARLQMGWMAEMVCMVGCTGAAIEVIEVMLGWIGAGCARLARLTTATAPGGPCGGKAFIMYHQGCQMAKFDPFLSFDCARVEGGAGGANRGKEGIKFGT